MSIKNGFSLRLAINVVVIMMSLILLLISTAFAQSKEEGVKPAAAAAAKAEEESSSTPSKTVTDFCSQRKTTQDREFCTRVFKLNPISASAQNNIALLKIAIDLTVTNARRTKVFMETLLNDDGDNKDNKLKPVLKPVLEECISAYENNIKQLKMIVTQDLEDDPPMSNFDAKMANQHLNRCQNSLNIISKIPSEGQLIRARNIISTAYGKLVEEISNTI